MLRKDVKKGKLEKAKNFELLKLNQEGKGAGKGKGNKTVQAKKGADESMASEPAMKKAKTKKGQK